MTPHNSLDWHQARRRQGVLTLSVLVGPTGPAVRAWRRWAAERPVVQRPAGPAADVLRAWLAAAFDGVEPNEPARAWVEHLTGRRVEPRTRYDLDALWRTLPLDAAAPAAVVAHHLLAAAIDRRPPDLHTLADPTAVLAGVCGLLPDARRPALLLTPPTGDVRDWFPTAARLLEGWAIVMPDLPLAVCVSADGFTHAVRPDDAGRTAALLREGQISVPNVTADELSARLQSAGVDQPPPAETITALTADGLTAEVAEAFVQLAAATTPDGCRSEAERFLLEQLEAMPETAGLFRPNQTLPFRHGNKPAEADLLADRLNLVVEVDGAYYHLTRDAYTRDRRKDWLYQRHGYVVLRFLAESVVSDLAEILTTVREAVRLRRPANEESPRA